MIATADIILLCHNCGREINPKTAVWLELNCRTGQLVKAGSAPWSDGPVSQVVSSSVLAADPKYSRRRSAGGSCNQREEVAREQMV